MRQLVSGPSFSRSGCLLFQNPPAPPWPLRCCCSLLGDCSLFGKRILASPLALSSVNLAHSLGNPLSKCQVRFEFNFDGIHIQRGVGNLDLRLPGGAARVRHRPRRARAATRRGVSPSRWAASCTSSISTTGTTQRTSSPCATLSMRLDLRGLKRASFSKAADLHCGVPG